MVRRETGTEIYQGDRAVVIVRALKKDRRWIRRRVRRAKCKRVVRVAVLGRRLNPRRTDRFQHGVDAPRAASGPAEGRDRPSAASQDGPAEDDPRKTGKSCRIRLLEGSVPERERFPGDPDSEDYSRWAHRTFGISIFPICSENATLRLRKSTHRSDNGRVVFDYIRSGRRIMGILDLCHHQHVLGVDFRPPLMTCSWWLISAPENRTKSRRGVKCSAKGTRLRLMTQFACFTDIWRTDLHGPWYEGWYSRIPNTGQSSGEILNLSSCRLTSSSSPSQIRYRKETFVLTAFCDEGGHVRSGHPEEGGRTPSIDVRNPSTATDGQVPEDFFLFLRNA